MSAKDVIIVVLLGLLATSVSPRCLFTSWLEVTSRTELQGLG
jgi:hypothetical protein